MSSCVALVVGVGSVVVGVSPKVSVGVAVASGVWVGLGESVVGVAVGSGVAVSDGAGVVGLSVGKNFCSCRYCCVMVPPAVGAKLGAPVWSLKMPISLNQWTIQLMPHSLKIFSSFANACCS